MAKAIRAYYGTDSYGRSTMMAQREDGVWFHRFYGYNGYAKAWGKWTKHEDKVEHPTEMRNFVEMPDAPEYIAIPVEEQENYVRWGFKNLRKCEHKGYRLPNKG